MKRHGLILKPQSDVKPQGQQKTGKISEILTTKTGYIYIYIYIKIQKNERLKFSDKCKKKLDVWN